MVYKHIDMFFFHSQQNLDDSVALGLVDRPRTRFFYWGDQLAYVDRTYKMSMGDFFISTGRENRDFDLMINAFAKTNAQLELYTNRINYDNNYESLEAYLNKYPNVNIQFVDKSNDTTLRLAQRTAECRCVMIPLMKNHVNYCVGLTSIIEAMAMGKPIISSPNPYSPVDITKERIGIVADTLDEWVAAIKYMNDHPEEAEVMGKRARLLAEQCYNINSTAQLLDEMLQSL
jgi:glycosyltransferase involved in cell wall biosynthesis